jgi:hypothetical protein
MSIEGQKFYPGERATACEIIRLANEYRHAADALRLAGRRGEEISFSPYRMVAIHSVELYLNAVLVAGGHPPAKLRGLHHDLASRIKFAPITELNLRTRTLGHIRRLSEAREYLATRYDPAPSTPSQLNRLEATLSQLAAKATEYVAQQARPTERVPEVIGALRILTLTCI